MEKEITFTIKTTERNLEAFLGAIELGSLLEHWCAIWSQSAINTYDMMSYRWFSRVMSIKNQIIKESNVKNEWMGYGEDKKIKTLINSFVTRECNKNIKYWDEGLQKKA